MPYLVVENGPDRGHKVELVRGRGVTFGRDPESTLTTSDHLCSRHHFQVDSRGERFVLVDAGSSNGTSVNDIKVTESDLADGDVIQAGETIFTFILDEKSGGRGLVGKTLGGYKILDRIGRGGMGTVYKALQVSLNRIVALKILSAKFSSDPSFVTRFQKEAQAAGRLNNPNIVQVYDVGADKNLHFYSMEFFENGSVQDLATKQGRLSADLVIAIGLDAARGLEYAEKSHLIHRDIKPDNLMITGEGVIKIADLGLARDAGQRARERGAHAGEHPDEDEGIFGTPHFISPEQAQGRKVDTRSDIYSLGATLYRLIAGDTPFQGDSVREIIRKQIEEEPAPIRDAARDCPAGLAQVVERMMRKDPDERFQSARELVEILERLDRRATERSRAPVIALATSLVVVVLAVVAFIAFSNNGDDPMPGPPVIPGPNGGENGRNAEEQAQLERERRRLEASKALNTLYARELAEVRERDETSLGVLLKEYEALSDQFGDTSVKADIDKHVEDVRAELNALRDAREAQAAERERRRQQAEKAVADALAAMETAVGQDRYGQALTLMENALASPVLAAREEAAQVREREIPIVNAAATAAAEAEAVAIIKKGELAFEQAADILRDKAAAFQAETDVALQSVQPVLELAKRLDKLSREALAEGEAKRRANLEADRGFAFKVRSRVALLMAEGYRPEEGSRLLETQRKGLLTEHWKDELDKDIADMAALVELRTALVAAARKELEELAAADREFKLKFRSSSDRNNLQVYTITGVDEKGLTAKRGPFEKTFVFSEFTPADLDRLVLSIVLHDDQGAFAPKRALALIYGQAPEDALILLESLEDPTVYPKLAEGVREEIMTLGLSDRVSREAAALKALEEIRKLQERAPSDNLAFLGLVPRIEAFLKSFKWTLVLLRNSDGSTQ